jgi:hypothetical protein
MRDRPSSTHSVHAACSEPDTQMTWRPTFNLHFECAQVVRAYATDDDRVHFPLFKLPRICLRSLG